MESEIIFKDGVEKIASVALDETRVDVLDIPDSVTEIGRNIVVREEGIVTYVIVCIKLKSARGLGIHFCSEYLIVQQPLFNLDVSQYYLTHNASFIIDVMMI